MIFMSCHKGPKRRQFQVASVSLGGDLRQGELTMDVVVPWNCNYSPISNKRRQIGGRSLMDEVNHVKMVVSPLLYSYVVYSCT